MSRVLLCDDSERGLAALRSVLDGEPGLEIVGEASDGEQAVTLTRELAPDMVVMDVRMPVLDGIAATAQIRALLPQTRVVALTAHEDPQLVRAMIEAGASAYCVKGAPLAELRHALGLENGRGHLDGRLVPAVFDELAQLYERERAAAVELAEANRALERRAAEQLAFTRGVVRALAAAVAARDLHTATHVDRVSRNALLLTERMAPELADDPRLEFGFLLHDVGKIGVPDAVLLKEGPLDAGELRLMRAHVEIGAALLEPIPGFDPVREIVLCHHERWDGRGYPAGLRGEQIPLTARIFAVCDAFDAITNDRPYRRARSEQEALRELMRCAGTQFDPNVVREFLGLGRRGLLGRALPPQEPS